MKTNRLISIFAGFTGLLVAHSATAGLINLVTNGEFEESKVNPGSWTATQIEGWQSTEGRIEIWNERFLWNGRLGSDGKTTGQHAEITWRHDRASIWTRFIIPEWFGGSDGQFRFDYQNRRAGGLWASVLINDAKPMDFSVSSRKSWSLFDETIGGLSGGDEVTLSFKSQGGGSMGAHIDQVQFLIDDTPRNALRLQSASAAVPAPGTIGLLAIGSALLGWRRRQRLL